MSAHRHPHQLAAAPGAAPVGRVLDLAPLELQTVIYLRLWSAGHRGRAEVWQDLVARVGADEAPASALAFETLARELLAAARRPLSRHDVGCPCLGADEAAVARAVALAAAGDVEDAQLILSWLAAPGAAPRLAVLAEDAGLRLASGAMPPRSCARPDQPM